MLRTEDTMTSKRKTVSHVLQVEETRPFFSRKLAVSLGMSKIVCGLLMLVFGTLTLRMDAYMGDIGSGVWTGMFVIVTGIFGVASGTRPESTTYLISFLCFSLLCIATSGVTVVLSATGIAHDNSTPNSYYVDAAGFRVSFLGEINIKTSAVAVNAVLLTLAVLDCILSMACAAISVREACQCYNFNPNNTSLQVKDPIYSTHYDIQNQKDNLLAWLKAQSSQSLPRTTQPIISSHVFPVEELPVTTGVLIHPVFCSKKLSSYGSQSQYSSSSIPNTRLAAYSVARGKTDDKYFVKTKPVTEVHVKNSLKIG
ncbi:uncharacterized protein LOC143255094 [Tachypleus tridentatus]|uniref:uncharacterized protein LOC143255094 n=1 Tax=Tachypleus tridentatus TaxID=6853 RepID=UPI003FD4C576